MRKVEYIQATGTQWINTGVKVEAGLKIEMDVYLDKIPSVLFGSNFNPITWDLKVESGSWKTLIDGTIYTLTTATANTRYNISYDFGSTSQTIQINNYSTTKSISLPSGTASNILIFARNTSQHILGLTDNAFMRLYSFKMYKNNVLIKDMIPTLDDSGVACLYDNVNGGLYYNQGVGDFFCFEAGLVFNRTNSDVINKTQKGYYNAYDLNRVERWCRKLADELNSKGYNINITTKTDWYLSDFADQQNLERIRKNILKIQRRLSLYNFNIRHSKRI